MRRLVPLLCWVAASSALAAPISFTVHEHAVGDGPADLVSNGIPFKPGELTNLGSLRILDGATELAIGTKVLARWPIDNSIRVALVQFLAPFTTATRTFAFDTAVARTTTDRTLVAVTWRYPKKIATLPAAQLTSSLVMWEQKPTPATGRTAFESLQISRFNIIDTEPVATTPCARTDQYYDTANSSYGIYVRTGGLPYLLNGRRWAHHHGRHQVYLTGTNIGHGICTGGYVDNTRYTFVDSLVRDYFFWGDEESLRVAGLIVDNFYMPHASSWYYRAPNTRGFWTEREAAFAQLGLLAYYEATGTPAYLDRARIRVHSLRQMQADNGNRAWVHNLYDHDPSEGCAISDYGSSSFMSGLMFESLIRYHKLTCDPLAAESLKWAVADLRTRNAATGQYAGRSLIYLGCPATNATYVNGTPDLDNLSSHGWAYAYRLSGFTAMADRTFAQALFDTAVADGYTGAPKQFNQAFRSAGNTPAYLDPAVPPLRNCASGTDGGTGGSGGSGGGAGGGAAGGSGGGGGGGGGGSAGGGGGTAGGAGGGSAGGGGGTGGGTAGGSGGGSAGGGGGTGGGSAGGSGGGSAGGAGGTGGSAAGGGGASSPAGGCGCSAGPGIAGLLAFALLVFRRRGGRRM